MKACRVCGCDRPARIGGTAHGLCRVHYLRWWRHGSTENRNRPWTPREDAMLLDLPINRRSGYVLRGYREDLALHLGRSPAALSVRRRELLRQRLEAARSIL